MTQESKPKPKVVTLCQTYSRVNNSALLELERIDIFSDKRIALKEMAKRHGKAVSSVVAYAHHDLLNRRAIPQTVVHFCGKNVMVKIHNKIVQEEVFK